MQTTINLAEVLGMLGAPILALLVGFLTRSSTPATIKTVLLLALSVGYGVLEEYFLSADGFNLWMALVKFLAAFVIAVNTHFGFSKPTGIAAALQDGMGFGIGAKPAVEGEVTSSVTVPLRTKRE